MSEFRIIYPDSDVAFSFGPTDVTHSFETYLHLRLVKQEKQQPSLLSQQNNPFVVISRQDTVSSFNYYQNQNKKQQFLYGNKSLRWTRSVTMHCNNRSGTGQSSEQSMSPLLSQQH